MNEETDATEIEETEIQPEGEIEETEDSTAETEAADSSPETEEPQSEEPEEEPKKDSVQERIDELTRLRREAERERDYWREQASQPEPIEKKSLEDFEYDEQKYQEHLIERAAKLAAQEARQAAREETEQASQHRKEAVFQSKESEFARKTEDYMQVTRNPNLPLTLDMYELAQDSELGPEILYYFGKNPEIAEAVAILSPRAQAREIGRIEAKLSTPREPSVTKAPAPPPKIAATSPATRINPASSDGDKLSTEEWLKRRRKQLGQ